MPSLNSWNVIVELANLFGKDSKYYSIPENTAIGRVRFVKKEAGVRNI